MTEMFTANQRKFFIKGIETKTGKLGSVRYDHMSDKDLAKLAAAILGSDIEDYILVNRHPVNKKLETLIKGSVPVEFTDASKETADALEILQTTMTYIAENNREYDFSSNLYWNNDETTAVIIW